MATSGADDAQSPSGAAVAYAVLAWFLALAAVLCAAAWLFK